MGRAESDNPPEPLTARVAARVNQKAKQLQDYCAPVLLAITHPPAERGAAVRPAALRNGHVETEAIDLKRLAGTMTLLLAMILHVSAVLLSLWDLHSNPQRSAVRLANVHIVERPHGRHDLPPLRMLVVNPSARYQLSGELLASLRARL